MKTLYLECNMGAAGDMLLSALYELLPDKVSFTDTMNGLIPGVSVSTKKVKTCGIMGTCIDVLIGGVSEESVDISPGNIHEHKEKHAHEHSTEQSHNSMVDIYELINGFKLPIEVIQNACAIYESLAEAESAVHGLPVALVHFHEVGALDAVIDITGVCLAMHILSPDIVKISPVNLGNGQVRCAHGILPVPTPATAWLLKEIPCYGGEIQGELCTPTGAALLQHFGEPVGSMPHMTIQSVGYGIGKKEFPAANCVRAFWGETGDSANGEIVELCCFIDDMTAEALAFASEQLMAQRALDVSAAPITMKKGRSGIAFTVLCGKSDEERLAVAILRETNTNGVRAKHCRKYYLLPSVETVETSYGPVKIKCADGYGIHHEKPEYESVAAIAREKYLPFQKVWEDVLKQIKSDYGQN